MRDIYINCHEAIIGSSPPDAASDIPVQLSKLAVGLYSLRYIASSSTKKRERGDSNIAVDGDDYDGGGDIHDGDNSYDNVKYGGKDGGYDGYDFKDGKDSGDDKYRKVMVTLNEDGGSSNNNNNTDDLMLEKYIIAPYMFKHVISQGNHEFSSGRQQDVSEYYQYLLQVITKTEKIHYPRYQTTANYNIAKLFEFHIETRMQCLATGINDDDDDDCDEDDDDSDCDNDDGDDSDDEEDEDDDDKDDSDCDNDSDDGDDVIMTMNLFNLDIIV